MKLKQAVIQCILSLSKDKQAPLQEAIALHKELFPTLPSPGNSKALIKALGQPLRTQTIPDREWYGQGVTLKPARQEEPIEEEPPAPATDTLSDPEVLEGSNGVQGKLRDQELLLLKERLYHHQKLIDATSDAQRKAIRKDQQQNQVRIKEIRDLIKEAEKGNNVRLPERQKSKAEQYMIIPDTEAEKELKIKKLSANRSKKKKIMDDNPEGSPKYTKAAQQFQELDQAIKAIRDAKVG